MTPIINRSLVFLKSTTLKCQFIKLFLDNKAQQKKSGLTVTLSLLRANPGGRKQTKMCNKTGNSTLWKFSLSRSHWPLSLKRNYDNLGNSRRAASCAFIRVSTVHHRNRLSGVSMEISLCARSQKCQWMRQNYCL